MGFLDNKCYEWCLKRGTIEGAFNYAAPLASAFILSEYEDVMTPTMDDKYTGDWTF